MHEQKAARLNDVKLARDLRSHFKTHWINLGFCLGSDKSYIFAIAGVVFEVEAQQSITVSLIYFRIQHFR
jgi:hypothetical protein